ncbi:hypothetical protein HELRODRAFT_161514 [Helobdella robusta]|uniref:Uncharacterized protein n=1 Tax=Helobdella robusta TaxID=6412 RepID=T1ERK8_HELRO|nr:hypothetical protein HELRODRAFT_161514 [Helobdella robusta]ESO02266.1 hypothetical protein HELRODRAFT_161514 [Helobdella robusta]
MNIYAQTHAGELFRGRIVLRANYKDEDESFRGRKIKESSQIVAESQDQKLVTGSQKSNLKTKIQKTEQPSSVKQYDDNVPTISDSLVLTIIRNALALVVKHLKLPYICQPSKQSHFKTIRNQYFIQELANEIKDELSDLVKNNLELLITITKTRQLNQDNFDERQKRGLKSNEEVVTWEGAPLMKSNSQTMTGRFIREQLIRISTKLKCEGMLSEKNNKSPEVILDHRFFAAMAEATSAQDIQELSCQLLDGNKVICEAREIVTAFEEYNTFQAKKDELILCLISGLIRTALSTIKDSLNCAAIEMDDILIMCSVLNKDSSHAKKSILCKNVENLIDKYSSDLMNNKCMEYLVKDTVKKIRCTRETPNSDEEISKHIFKAAKRFVSKVIENLMSEASAKSQAANTNEATEDNVRCESDYDYEGEDTINLAENESALRKKSSANTSQIENKKSLSKKSDNVNDKDKLLTGEKTNESYEEEQLLDEFLDFVSKHEENNFVEEETFPINEDDEEFNYSTLDNEEINDSQKNDVSEEEAIEEDYKPSENLDNDEINYQEFDDEELAEVTDDEEEFADSVHASLETKEEEPLLFSKQESVKYLDVEKSIIPSYYSKNASVANEIKTSASVLSKIKLSEEELNVPTMEIIKTSPSEKNDETEDICNDEGVPYIGLTPDQEAKTPSTIDKSNKMDTECGDEDVSNLGMTSDQQDKTPTPNKKRNKTDGEYDGKDVSYSGQTPDQEAKTPSINDNILTRFSHDNSASLPLDIDVNETIDFSQSPINEASTSLGKNTNVKKYLSMTDYPYLTQTPDQKSSIPSDLSPTSFKEPNQKNDALIAPKRENNQVQTDEISKRKTPDKKADISFPTDDLRHNIPNAGADDYEQPMFATASETDIPDPINDKSDKMEHDFGRSNDDPQSFDNNQSDSTDLAKNRVAP